MSKSKDKGKEKLKKKSKKSKTKKEIPLIPLRFSKKLNEAWNTINYDGEN